MKEGLHEDLDIEIYHSDLTHYSSSSLKDFDKDREAFYKKYVLKEEGKKKSSDALTMGQYVHCAILEPHLLDKEFAFYDGIRRGKKWDAFKEENKKPYVMKTSQKELCDKMIAVFNTSEVETGKGVIPVGNFYKFGIPELSLFTELGGVKVKTRYDYFNNDEKWIADLKTTREPLLKASEETVANICFSFGYDISAALYVDAWKKYHNEDVDFYLTFMSKADFGVMHVKCSEDFLEGGRREYRRILKEIKECFKTGNWDNPEPKEEKEPIVNDIRPLIEVRSRR